MRLPNSMMVKHRHLFIYYILYLKKNKEKAQSLSRRRICMDVSKPFYIQAQAASKIISKMLKSGYNPSKVDISEFKERFKEIEEIQSIIGD